MAYAIMNISKLKSNSDFAKAHEHNYRLTDVPNADKELLHRNEELIKRQHANYIDAYNARIAESEFHRSCRVRKDAVRGLEVLMTFTNDPSLGLNIETWKKLNVEWITETFGEENVISMTYHGDESTPHIHGIVIPMNGDRLSANHHIGNKQKLRELQDSYGKCMEPLGLRRGLRNSIAKHTDIKKFYARLNKELEKELPDIQHGESVEDYRYRATIEYEVANVRHFKDRLAWERQMVEAKTQTNNIRIDARSAINQLSWKARERDELVREFGSTTAIKEDLNKYKFLKDGLDNLNKNEPNEAYRIAEFKNYMNAVIEWQISEEEARRRRERSKKRESGIDKEL